MSTIKFKNRARILFAALIVFMVGCISTSSVGKRDAFYYHTETTVIERQVDSMSIVAKKDWKMNYKRFTAEEATLLFSALEMYESEYGKHIDELVDAAKAPTADQRAAVTKRYEGMRDKNRSEISVIKRKIYTLKK